MKVAISKETIGTKEGTKRCVQASGGDWKRYILYISPNASQKEVGK